MNDYFGGLNGAFPSPLLAPNYTVLLRKLLGDYRAVKLSVYSCN